jgi:hypothetical protein
MTSGMPRFSANFARTGASAGGPGFPLDARRMALSGINMDYQRMAPPNFLGTIDRELHGFTHRF